MNGICRALLVLSVWLIAPEVSAAAATRPLAVLVPGYFNLPGRQPPLLPGEWNYFSKVVVSTLQAEGFETHVIRDLNPVGTMAENGAALLRDLENLVAAHPDARISVIAHSAGGIYTAKALTENPRLPIQTVVTIATPYQGAELADLVKWVPGYEEITRALDLTSLYEFESGRIGGIVSTLKVPRRVRWVALGAAQEVCALDSCLQADHMSSVLSLAWSFMDEPGDGVVSLRSATQVALNRHEGGQVAVEHWPDLPIALDHWKVVVEADNFRLVGVTDPEWIGRSQRALFQELGRRLRQR